MQLGDIVNKDDGPGVQQPESPVQVSTSGKAATIEQEQSPKSTVLESAGTSIADVYVNEEQQNLTEQDHAGTQERPPWYHACVITFGGATGSTTTVEMLESAEGLDRHLAVKDEHKQMYVLFGVHLKFAEKLYEELKIDPAVFDTHVDKTRYSPSVGWWLRPSCVQIDFPELEVGNGIPDREVESSFFLPERGARRPVPGTNPNSTVWRFQRATWWQGSEVSNSSVLLLDLTFPETSGQWLEGVLEHSNSAFLRAIRKTDVVFKPRIGQLRRRFLEAVQNPTIQLLDCNAVVQLITVLSFDQWAFLMTPPKPHNHYSLFLKDLNVFRIAARIAEDNFLAALVRQKWQSQDISAAALTLENEKERWKTLLELVRNRISDIEQQMTKHENHNPKKTVESTKLIRHTRDEDETHRSLNRIAYLGAVLLPFTTVSSLFSMAPDFGPGGHWFFAYWTICIPSMLIIVAVVYADIIRKRMIRAQYPAHRSWHVRAEDLLLGPAWRWELTSSPSSSVTSFDYLADSSVSVDAARTEPPVLNGSKVERLLSTRLFHSNVVRRIAQIAAMTLFAIMNIAFLGIPALLSLYNRKRNSGRFGPSGLSSDSYSSYSSGEVSMIGTQPINTGTSLPNSARPLPRPVLCRAMEPVALSSEQELGWLGAFSTLFGYKPAWSNDDDSSHVRR